MSQQVIHRPAGRSGMFPVREGGPLVDVLSIYVDTHGDELFIQAGLTRPIDTCIPLLLVLYFFLDLLYRHLTRLLEHNFSSDGHTEG